LSDCEVVLRISLQIWGPRNTTHRRKVARLTSKNKNIRGVVMMFYRTRNLKSLLLQNKDFKLRCGVAMQSETIAMKTRENGRVEHQRRFRRGFRRPSQERNHMELQERSCTESLKRFYRKNINRIYW